MTIKDEFRNSNCVDLKICRQCKYFEPYHGMKFDNCERGVNGKYWKLKPQGSDWQHCTGFEKRE